MKHGDHVKIIGRDGVYVFLKEVQGMATLRRGGQSRDEPTLAIPIDDVVSLEHTNVTCSILPVINPGPSPSNREPVDKRGRQYPLREVSNELAEVRME